MFLHVGLRIGRIENLHKLPFIRWSQTQQILTISFEYKSFPSFTTLIQCIQLIDVVCQKEFFFPDRWRHPSFAIALAGEMSSTVLLRGMFVLFLIEPETGFRLCFRSVLDFKYNAANTYNK